MSFMHTAASTTVAAMYRRTFLHTLVAAGMAPGMIGAREAAAFEGLRVGVIGCGWYGKNDVFRLLQIAPVEVVSICDPDRRMLDEAAPWIARRQVSKKEPARFGDYREMLAAKNVDLVIVGTPDHWHTLPTIAALKAGAHVYLQKPVAVDVDEGFAILDAARRAGRVVQIGTQRRSTPHLIEAKEKVVEAGLLGTVGHVDLFSYYHMRRGGQPPDRDPPPELDWEMWTGPAALRPYHDGIHPGGWRSYREYGNGFVGDMCIHMLDTARWLLGIGWPHSIVSTGGVFIDPDAHANVPDTQTASFEYDDLTISWQHRTWGAAADPAWPWGLVIYGSKGTLKAGVLSYEFTPVGDTQPTLRADAALECDAHPEEREEPRFERHAAPATRRHLADMLRCMDKGGRPVADIEEINISSACCVLANLSLDTGRVLSFDPAQRLVHNDPDATLLLQRPYREPWQHPAPSRA